MMTRCIKTAGIITVLLALIMVFTGCTSVLDDPFADFHYEKEQETIETKEVIRDDLIINVTLFAKSIPVAKVTHFYTEVTGYLQEYTVEMLQEVKAGDVIAILDSSNLDKEFRDQSISYEKAKLRYDKTKLQYETNDISENEMLAAKLDFEYEEYKYNKILEQYAALELKSEIDGVVNKRQAHPGDWISAQTPIADIMDKSEILISFDSNEASGLRVGDTLSIDIRNSDLSVPAEIISINGTETILKPEYVHESFDKVGALVYVSILKDMRLDALLLDDDCIVTEGDRSFVYVLEDGVKTERDIKVGISDAGLVEILYGLEEGEAVVYRPY